MDNCITSFAVPVSCTVVQLAIFQELETVAQLWIPMDSKFVNSFFSKINRSEMADDKKSGSISETVREETSLTSKIPPGHQHNRCRQALTNEGAGVNTQQDGLPPLMFAVSESHEECVKELIKAGADVNKKDTEGNTALNIAASKPSYASKHSQECLRILLKAGADVNIVNEKGDTPLLTSLNSGLNEKHSEALLDAGADCECCK